ncbi:hypothetical protein ZIOFF_038171 [Zingiber officinale]|uniref:Uncharacterized protein n=1 Tax=Zingiber officinale TaxID=94328 RepID=A0A8J5GE92_ZINOF|nr:hypothetical protein ZIOFF_038171 [Zingiber officinale]
MRVTGSCEATTELYALANRSNFSLYSYSGSIINGVKFLVEQRDTSLVKAEVERLAMRAIQERRCKMRRHWKQLDGLQNKNMPKRKPYKGVNQDDWNFLCDYFGKKEQMEQYDKNINNRFCRPLEDTHGSKSLVQHYHATVDPMMGELPSMIDTFEQLFHKGGQLKNDWAAQKYAEMVEIQSIQLEGVVSISIVDNVHHPKDSDIMTQVLGSRSRYMKDLSPLTRLSIEVGPRATNISSKHNDDSEKITAMQQMIDEQKHTIGEQQKTIGEQQQRFDALL